MSTVLRIIARTLKIGAMLDLNFAHFLQQHSYCITCTSTPMLLHSNVSVAGRDDAQNITLPLATRIPNLQVEFNAPLPAKRSARKWTGEENIEPWNAAVCLN